MRRVTIFLLAACCVAPVITLRAHDSSSSFSNKNASIGTFSLQGTGAKDSVLLTNNVFYKPSHKHDEKKTKDWQIGDSINVLRTKDKKKFILVNQRTGESIKAKILHWD